MTTSHTDLSSCKELLFWTNAWTLRESTLRRDCVSEIVFRKKERKGWERQIKQKRAERKESRQERKRKENQTSKDRKKKREKERDRFRVKQRVCYLGRAWKVTPSQATELTCGWDQPTPPAGLR